MVTYARCKVKRFLCVVFMIAFICSHGTIITHAEKDSADTTADLVQSNINIYQGAADRSYTLEIEIFSGESQLEAVAESSIVLLLDAGSGARNLSEEPGELQTYQAGLTYPSIDQSTALYTMYDGKYVPILLQENQWYLSELNEDGGEAAAGEPIGIRENQEDSFIQDVYAKGDTLTVWESQKNAAEALINRLEKISPDSEVGLVFFSDTIKSTSLYKLDTEGTAALKEALANHASHTEEGQNMEEALKQAGALLEKASLENQYVIVYTASDFRGEEEESKEASSLAQEMKMDDQKLHIIDFSGNTEVSELFTDIASKPEETYYHQTTPADLETVSCDALDAINRAQTMTAAYVIDPRFTLTNGQRSTFEESGIQVTDREDGATEISWEVTLPRSVEYAESMKIEIEAQKNFLGGNDVPVSEAESGIYQFDIKVCDFRSCSINVPLYVQLQDIETDIFLGQVVPVTLRDKSIEDLVTEDVAFDWYGKGSTGEITYFWQDKEGSQFESISELKDQKPGEDKVYVITMTYTPGATGNESIGAPIAATKLTAKYKVNVIAGTVRVHYALAEQENQWNEDSYAVFKLSNDRFTQYATVTLADRDEDGENINLEAIFKQVPYGVYTLTQEYSHTDESGTIGGNSQEETCIIGLVEGSDKIDLNQTECVLYLHSSLEVEAQEKEGYYAQMKVNRFNIEK